MYSNILELQFDLQQKQKPGALGSGSVGKLSLTTRDYARADFSYLHTAAQLALFTPEQREAWISERARKYEAEGK